MPPLLLTLSSQLQRPQTAPTGPSRRQPAKSAPADTPLPPATTPPPQSPPTTKPLQPELDEHAIYNLESGPILPPPRVAWQAHNLINIVQRLEQHRPSRKPMRSATNRRAAIFRNRFHKEASKIELISQPTANPIALDANNWQALLMQFVERCIDRMDNQFVHRYHDNSQRYAIACRHRDYQTRLLQQSQQDQHLQHLENLWGNLLALQPTAPVPTNQAGHQATTDSSEQQQASQSQQQAADSALNEQHREQRLAQDLGQPENVQSIQPTATEPTDEASPPINVPDHQATDNSPPAIMALSPAQTARIIQQLRTYAGSIAQQFFQQQQQYSQQQLQQSLGSSQQAVTAYLRLMSQTMPMLDRIYGAMHPSVL